MTAPAGDASACAAVAAWDVAAGPAGGRRALAGVVEAAADAGGRGSKAWAARSGPASCWSGRQRGSGRRRGRGRGRPRPASAVDAALDRLAVGLTRGWPSRRRRRAGRSPAGARRRATGGAARRRAAAGADVGAPPPTRRCGARGRWRRPARRARTPATPLRRARRRRRARAGRRSRSCSRQRALVRRLRAPPCRRPGCRPRSRRGGPALSAGAAAAVIARVARRSSGALDGRARPGRGTGPTGWCSTGRSAIPRPADDRGHRRAVAGRIAARGGRRAGRSSCSCWISPATGSRCRWATWTPRTTVAVLVPGHRHHAGRRPRPAGAATPRTSRPRRGPRRPGAPVATRGLARLPDAGHPWRPAPRAAAERGGPALASGARRAGGRPRGRGDRAPARTTVVAHSYGTVVVDEAADAAGPARRRRRRPAGQPRDGGRRGGPGGAGGLRRRPRRPTRSPGSAGSATADRGRPRYGATALPTDPRDGPLRLLRPEPPDAGRDRARWWPGPRRAG